MTTHRPELFVMRNMECWMNSFYIFPINLDGLILVSCFHLYVHFPFLASVPPSQATQYCNANIFTKDSVKIFLLCVMSPYTLMNTYILNIYKMKLNVMLQANVNTFVQYALFGLCCLIETFWTFICNYFYFCIRKYNMHCWKGGCDGKKHEELVIIK